MERAKKHAVFDIGSGSVKFLIGRYGSFGEVISYEHGSERPVPFGTSWVKSQDGNLSEEVQEKGFHYLKYYKNIAVNNGITRCTGIATEVFRKAKNGNDYISKIRNELDIDVNVISQDEEAELGYRTGMGAFAQLCRSHQLESETVDTILQRNNIVVWDSGSASFQLTTTDNTGRHVSYMAAYGTAVSVNLLLKIRQQRDSHTNAQSSNPVSKVETLTLIERLRSDFPTTIPEWFGKAMITAALSGKKEGSRLDRGLSELLEEAVPVPALTACTAMNDLIHHGKGGVIAIGGYNSMFQIANNIINYHKHERTDVAAARSSSDSPEDNENNNSHWSVLYQSDIEYCIDKCLNKTNDELDQYITYKYSDGTNNMLPKLCLLYAVMQQLNLSMIYTVRTTGCCEGLLEYYADRSI